MITSRQWYKLDNAAKLYPAIESSKRPGIFRVSIGMHEEIDPSILQIAAHKTIVRFPTFAVRLVTGIFWYYFEANTHELRIEEDATPLCRRIDRRATNGYLFRVRYGLRHIALEVFHAIADGSGALEFLKTLAAEYLQLTHTELIIPCTNGVKDCTAPPNQGELEDAFSRYYTAKPRRPKAEGKVFHLKGTPLPYHRLALIIGTCSAAVVKDKSKELNVSVTDFIVSVYVYALYRIQEKRNAKKYAIKISVPVNMRNLFPSETVRNFSLFVKPGIYPYLGDYTFHEIVNQVHHFMKLELNEKYLSEVLGANVFIEKKMLIRLMPLSIKNKMITYVFNHYGENLYSGSLSNLGMVTVPQEMKPYVRNFGFALGVNKINPTNGSVITYGDTLSVTFSRTLAEAQLEKEFFTLLIDMGIPVKISEIQPNQSKAIEL